MISIIRQNHPLSEIIDIVHRTDCLLSQIMISLSGQTVQSMIWLADALALPDNLGHWTISLSGQSRLEDVQSVR